MRISFLLFVVFFMPFAVISQVKGEDSSIYVEPITLSEVMENSGFNLNIGAIVSNEEFGKGLQKAADVYGLKLDLFYSDSIESRKVLLNSLIFQNNTFIVMDEINGENIKELKESASKLKIPFEVAKDVSKSSDANNYEKGFSSLKKIRAAIVDKIPKYDQILPIAFPISPMPDDFFQPSKFPYPSPLVRVPRTNESLSASVHAHTSCNMVAQTGNMLHYTSNLDKNLLLMGMEGGNLSLSAKEGAIEKNKISSVMTSWVLDIDGENGEREILVENNGRESSFFNVGIHALEELYICLDKWKKQGEIDNYLLLNNEKVKLFNWQGKDVVLKAGMFLVANDKSLKEPSIIQGNDSYGAKTIDFYSTQAFVQQLVQVNTLSFTETEPNGGILSSNGATVSNYFGKPVSNILHKVIQDEGPVDSYVLNIEGGFMSVTPEDPKRLDSLIEESINGLYIDLRGPLTSDQTIELEIKNQDPIILRRTIMNFDQINYALNSLKSMGFISNWDFEGARGQGLYANIILYNFLGKNRKFMSSLCIYPTDEITQKPLLRFYVDGMQRLNIGFLSDKGWRQEFVEVPLRIPPVPRDIDLYSGISSLKE